MATNWLVSTQNGNDTYGGTSIARRSNGTDGISVSGDLTKFTSISATWGAGDVGHGIYASSGTISRLISAVQVSQTATGTTNSSTTITSSAAFNSTMLHCAISGPGIAANTYVSAFGSTSSMTLSTTAGAGSGTGTFTFGPLLTTTGTTAFTAATAQTWNVGGMIKTFARAMVTASGVHNCYSAGDFIYVGAGTYRETVANTLSGSAGNVISIIGDVDGAKTGDAGQVTLTGWTTSDTASPSSTTLLALAATTNLSFSFITFISGSAGIVTNTAPAAAPNYTFTDCVFNEVMGFSLAMSFISSTTGLALGITIDRCIFLGSTGVTFSLTETASGAADFDVLCVVRNCLFMLSYNLGATTSGAITVTGTGSTTFKGGGVRVYDCTIMGPYFGFTTGGAQVSTSVPCEIHNCVIGAHTGISAFSAGQITGSYNVIYAANGEANYTYGTGDVSNSAGTGTYKAPLLELGQSWKWAGVLRQFLAPDGHSSPLLGAGSATFSGNYPTVDWANRPRPSGGGSANASVGYSELHDFSVKNTVVYPSGQTTSAAMTGPGDTDIWVPVDAVSTTLAVQLYQNAGYSGAVYATAQIIAQGEIGVVANTQTCSSTTGSWQTLTFPAQTPTAAGYIKIRVTSYDTSGTGILYFGALVAS